MTKFNYGIDNLTIGIALDLARGKATGIINEKAKAQIDKSSKSIQEIIDKDVPLYGVNTGFGQLCSVAISKEDTVQLQENILKSHSVGLGEPIPEEISRLMLITKIHSLSKGYSGITLKTLLFIKMLFDQNITPVVPCQGSVGASGDLAPLAHLFLPVLGLGKVYHKGIINDTAEVFQQEGIEPIKLSPKEGLALLNGTQFILSFAVIVMEKLHNCLDTADIIGAMSLEASLGSVKPFLPELHQLRPYIGTNHVAHRLKTLLQGSEMVDSHQNCDRVQDPYSLRCMPQVHGATRNSWLHLKDLVNCELNSVTDNPIVFDANHTISGGNFHGQPLALPLDYCGYSAAEIGNISDRRTYLLLEGKNGLPLFLMKHTGINSGFMIPQYTSAALVSENKSFCFPASADSIPTSVGQEDHVSMGSISGRKTNMIIDNLEKILAVELTCGAQAFDYRRPLKSSVILEACHELLRSRIDHTEEDRIFSEDIEKALSIIKNHELTNLSNEIAKIKNIDLNGTHDGLFNLY
ncbi:MAG: histidine ammonia-lyase [Bacteroidales bacterium]|nr:histidine ammonia-lyase [Bacteroidales bacterium]